MPGPVAGAVAEQDRHVCPAKGRAEFAAESEMAVEVAGWALPGPAGRDAPRCSLWRETPNRVQSAGPVLRLSYLEIFDDSMYSINTNRKITPQNRYLHTFSSVNCNISRLSWIY